MYSDLLNLRVRASILVDVTCVRMRRLKVFKATLLKLFKLEHAQSLELERVRSFVNDENAGSEFSDGEMTAAIERMSDDNQIMLADNVIFLI